MSFGIPVRNGLGIGLRASTSLSTRSSGGTAPAIALDFLAGAPIDSRVTFTRASTATFVGSNGLIQSAAIDAPRFDYNPTTLAAKGLLIEEQRTNLILHSEDYTNAAWNKFVITVTGNTTVAPDGTTTADTLSGSVGANSAVNQEDPATAGQTYTYSFYMRKTTATTNGLYSTVSIEFLNGTTSLVEYGAVINSDSGTLIAPSGWGTAPFTISSVENVGDYWRVRGTSSAAPATTNKVIVWLSVAGGFLNGTRGITGISSKIVWGAQLEVGAFPTSYIPTVASQVTRSADIATITGTNFSSWFNATQGTFVFAGDSAYGSGGFIGSTPTTGAILYANANASRTSNGTNVITTANTYANNAVFNTALGYSASGRSLVLNGGTIATDANLIQTPTAITLGGAFGGNYLNGHARAISFYNTRLSDATLQALTT
jgi:hypothetical protein